jgi:hypothetical protein
MVVFNLIVREVFGVVIARGKCQKKNEKLSEECEERLTQTIFQEIVRPSR